MESLNKDGMYSHPKFGSDVELDITTHAPRGFFKKFTHIMRLAKGTGVGAYLKMALDFMMIRG